jgi:uncharacterized membrane protein
VVGHLVRCWSGPAGPIDAYDTAVVDRKADGKVEIVKEYETPNLSTWGRWHRGGSGHRPIFGGDAVLGALASHAAAGMSRNDLKELREGLDSGQAGLVVVAVSDIGSKVEEAMRRADKNQIKDLKADLMARSAESDVVGPESRCPILHLSGSL